MLPCPHDLPTWWDFNNIHYLAAWLAISGSSALCWWLCAVFWPRLYVASFTAEQHYRMVRIVNSLRPPPGTRTFERAYWRPYGIHRRAIVMALGGAFFLLSTFDWLVYYPRASCVPPLDQLFGPLESGR